MPTTLESGEAKKLLVREFGACIGSKLKEIRPLNKKEIEDFGWDVGGYDIPFALVFENGQVLIPSQDPEGNGPGWLFAGELA